VLGYIDDVDETYINGNKIGRTGSFPPDYISAYNAKRVYYLPEKYLNYESTNVITVKVYDSYQVGGIASGDIGIYINPDEAPLEINLQGKWKFKPGDDLERAQPDYDDNHWTEIFVPAKWEDQGYRNFDGYGWYRKEFIYRGNLNDDKVVLLLGRIDDVDEVYVNGIKIGSTGEFDENGYRMGSTDQRYRAFRGYYLDTRILKKNQKNVIAVRVYDSGGEGGIYEGPIGFITQTDYINFWRKRKRSSY
jgi:sialate O-acetylesterase